MTNKHCIVKLVASIVLVSTYVLLPKYGFVSADMDPLSHILYPLCHANIWHLAANIMCLWMLPCRLHIYVSYALAVLCSYLPCFSSEPTVGFSGVLFVIVGISWGKIHQFKNMLWRNKWYLIIPAFLPHVNFMIHIYCLLAGYLYGLYARRDKEFDKREP